MSLSAAPGTQTRKLPGVERLRTIKQCAYAFLYRKELRRLAVVFGTDKEGAHFYAGHYQHHFQHMRRRDINLLEIGIGGYQNPKAGGQSLRMWKAYFTKGKIFGIDIHKKRYHDEKRIKTFKGSQTDDDFLKSVAEEIGGIDIVIDDGSHRNTHVIKTFKTLFPLLKHDGIYVIEDLQTSYWEEMKGTVWDGSKDLDAPFTSMNFLKRLVDGLNYEEFSHDDYAPTYFDRNIISVHFYHNLAFIYKGDNSEGSNVLGKRFS